MFQRDPGNTGSNATVSAVPENGTRRWRIRGRMSTPVVGDGTVYVADFTDERALVARELSTGREQWRSSIPHGQVGPAPAITDNRVIHQSFGMIHAFDRDQGEELWTHDPGNGAPGAPAVVDGTVYTTKDSFKSDPATATAISADDGTERWQVSVRGERASTLAYGNDTVFVGSSRGFVVALDADDGAERWRFEAEAGVTSAISTAGDLVYAVDNAGVLYALSAETGDEQWRATVSNGERWSAPAIGDDAVYVGTEDGVTAVGLDEGAVQWEFSTDGPVGTPTTDGDAVYFGGTDWDHHAIHAIDAESGQQRWSHETDRREEGDHTVVGVFGSPVPVENRLLVVTADGLSTFESA